MVTSSMVSCCSPMALNRADWVRGVARLISSARTIWEMNRAGPELKLPRLLL